MEALIICNDISKDKILIPKAKRVVPKQKHQKRKKIATNKAQKRKLEINELQKEKIINLDFITLDEINKDFNNLTDKLEEQICYEEIFNFLSSSSDESSIDFNIKDDIVKRPKKNGF